MYSCLHDCEICCHEKVCAFKNSYKRIQEDVRGCNSDIFTQIVQVTVSCPNFLWEGWRTLRGTMLKQLNDPSDEEDNEEDEEDIQS